MTKFSGCIISKCDAKYFLDNSTPTITKLSAKYYEIAPTSSEYTGYTVDVQLGDFFSSLKDTLQNPYAILGSVNTTSTQETKENTENTSKDSSYTAGQTPINNKKTNIENMGLAVFRGDNLVGELNGIETICHLIVTNELETCTITIPSPFSTVDSIDLYVELENKTQNKVKLVNGAPYITTKVHLYSRVLSVNKNSDYLTEENIKKIEEYTNSYIESNISQYLYKTSKKYNTDIAGFGKYVIHNFLYWDEWQQYNWLNNYSNAFFNVDVTTNLRSGYLIMDT